MPQKRRKSFLELLTGASEAEEAEDVSGKISASVSDSPPMEQPEPQPTTAPAPAEPKSDSWLSEGDEGQLTLDVYEVGDTVVIQSTIAGVNAEDLEVNINNDMVTIKGERKQEQQVAEGSYYYQELYWGAFSRSVILPVEVDAKKAEAELKNGILTIRLPKKESERKHKIEVKAV